MSGLPLGDAGDRIGSGGHRYSRRSRILPALPELEVCRTSATVDAAVNFTFAPVFIRARRTPARLPYAARREPVVRFLPHIYRQEESISPRGIAIQRASLGMLTALDKQHFFAPTHRSPICYFMKLATFLP